MPSEESFAIHCLVRKHFWKGAYYPRGGAKVISEEMLANVLDNGGQVVISAKVLNLIVENGTCKGVELTTGEKFYAKNIISATGAHSTVS